ncbi:hypothetical protein OSB04_019433 [Centaurea solstitialis]|uniref:Retrovirus-related Pol polyprotein from transposon TNT 1-94 n=1 Tax=Centaurea solstitialis TaxID=347529 RepID=A0AA38WCD9_9ASTR|nr:hypothetical protein OSB04_019433 [Centaurea solstitialis]
MSMIGELTFFLGLQVKQSSEGVFINQSKYIQYLLKKYKLNDASPMRTPMATGLKLHKDLSGPTVECKLYRGMIGSLLYLIASRPDIMFSTCICARYQANPKESHLSSVKRILRYLKKTQSLGLWYPLYSRFDLVAYTDSDYGGCQMHRKSTSRSCQFLGGKLVSWSSRKQNCVSTSIAEAEYVVAASCCSQALWIQTQLHDYGCSLNKIPILYDSKSAIAISTNPMQHSKTKHIDIRYHFLKHHVEEGNVEMYFVTTEFQLADLFTKALDEKRFNFLVEKIGMKVASQSLCEVSQRLCDPVLRDRSEALLLAPRCESKSMDKRSKKVSTEAKVDRSSVKTFVEDQFIQVKFDRISVTLVRGSATLSRQNHTSHTRTSVKLAKGSDHFNFYKGQLLQNALDHNPIPQEFQQWKIRMVNFLEGIHPRITEFLHNPPYIPLKLIPRVPATATTAEVPEHYQPKNPTDWDEEDKEMVSLAPKCKRLLIMALPNDIFMSLDHCVTSKELWDKILRQLEGGVASLKNNRTMCINEYHEFKAKEGESLKDTYSRFNFLISKCKRSGVIRTNEENNMLFLKSLRNEWLHLTMSMRTNQDLEIMSLADLYGSLASLEPQPLCCLIIDI